MINGFVHDRIVEDGVSPKTVNRCREVLHRLFKYAIAQYGYICPDKRYKNPVEGVQRIKESTKAISWLTFDDITEQLSALEGHPTIHALVALYIYAGLRREEALWLTHDDVDLNRRLIRVQAKTVEGESWETKTKKNRVVPISRALLNILRNYQPSHKAVWFFPSPNGKRWHPDNFSEDLRDINRECGLSWSCLDFRHTFGSHLAQKGESLYKIAELMGNSPEICRKHYAALVPEEMHDTVEFTDKSKSSFIIPAEQPRLRLVR